MHTQPYKPELTKMKEKSKKAKKTQLSKDLHSGYGKMRGDFSFLQLSARKENKWRKKKTKKEEEIQEM